MEGGFGFRVRGSGGRKWGWGSEIRGQPRCCPGSPRDSGPEGMEPDGVIEVRGGRGWGQTGRDWARLELNLDGLEGLEPHWDRLGGVRAKLGWTGRG